MFKRPLQGTFITFEHAAHRIARRQLMAKAEEQTDLTRLQILLLFYPPFIKPKSHSPQLLSLPGFTLRVNKKFVVAVNESL